ncbi:MAG TPA: ferritin-like domain-containing protein [Devosia sp.]|nr:ferritin-like domain-containing protein [Devosia sp.]
MTDLTPSRRHVLKWTGVAATLAIAGSVLPNFGISAALAADLGSGDIGVLNYAYALEQLEAAFYTQAVKTPYSGITKAELATLHAIRDHEIAHREFLRKALGKKAIPNLEVDFSKIDFTSRSSVLGTADVFENLGVAAYNGAGQLIKTVAYLAAAGSIVSVEARHCAAIAELLHGAGRDAAGGSHVDFKGLDEALSPKEVLPKAAPFIKTPVTANSLA